MDGVFFQVGGVREGRLSHEMIFFFFSGNDSFKEYGVQLPKKLANSSF